MNNCDQEFRRVWRSGDDKGKSYCISIPIAMARKYCISEKDYVVCRDTDEGILISKIMIGKHDSRGISEPESENKIDWNTDFSTSVSNRYRILP